jgi:hypothetical protein
LADREHQERLYLRDFQKRHVVAVLFGPRWDIMPTVRENFTAWARTFGLAPVLERVFKSPAGTVIFEVYSVDGTHDASGAVR